MRLIRLCVPHCRTLCGCSPQLTVYTVYCMLLYCSFWICSTAKTHANATSWRRFCTESTASSSAYVLSFASRSTTFSTGTSLLGVHFLATPVSLAALYLLTALRLCCLLSHTALITLSCYSVFIFAQLQSSLLWIRLCFLRASHKGNLVLFSSCSNSHREILAFALWRLQYFQCRISAKTNKSLFKDKMRMCAKSVVEFQSAVLTGVVLSAWIWPGWIDAAN